MRVTRRRIGLPTTCAFLLALSVMSVPSVRAVGAGGTAGAAAEVEFLELLNQARAAASLPALQADDALVGFARSHTFDMIGRGDLFHSSKDRRIIAAPVGWRRMGENVGVGNSPATLHQAFMASSRHRDNILGDYDGVAIGAGRSRDGRLYVTVVFVKHGTSDPVRVARLRRTRSEEPASRSASLMAPPLSRSASIGER